MAAYFDQLETRSADERARDWAAILPDLVAHAKGLAGYRDTLAETDPAAVVSPDKLAALPVLRKSDLAAAQAAHPPFGGYVADSSAIAHAYQSPGNIYEPGSRARDWYRMGRFLHAAGIGPQDLVQNCFSYHMTPAGMIFENGAEAVGARVFPAGIGQTEQQITAAAHLGVTAFAGTPDYLKVLLEAGDAAGLDLSRITRAAVGGGALFPSLRAYYADRGIACLQCYATADLGNIAYESPAMEGLIVDEGVLVEIVVPGTGTPVAPGEVGEVVVTTSNRDYALIRFATGDLSALLPGESPCGRTNMRIKGWMGRADQTTKVKGMFVKPEQVAAIRAQLPGCGRARIVVTRAGDMDHMVLKIENANAETALGVLREVTKLGGTVEVVGSGDLPADGVVIEDQRDYDA